jgi:hypothetical protein
MGGRGILLWQIVEVLVDDTQIVEGLCTSWIEVCGELVHGTRFVRLAVLCIRHAKVVHGVWRLGVVKQCLPMCVCVFVFVCVCVCVRSPLHTLLGGCRWLGMIQQCMCAFLFIHQHPRFQCTLHCDSLVHAFVYFDHGATIYIYIYIYIHTYIHTHTHTQTRMQ